MASSASVHLSLRMLGFTLWRQRWAHCWPVRPGISSATEAQRLPYLACVHGVGGVSGESCQQARARATTGWKEAYLEAREHLILRFGPRSTLEVDVIGHERWVWGRERGEGRAMRCVFCGVARGAASVMTFFARSAWETSLEIFFSPNRRICHGVRFSPLLITSPPRLVGDLLLGGMRAPRRVLIIADERPGARRCHDDGGGASPHTAVRAGPDERHD